MILQSDNANLIILIDQIEITFIKRFFLRKERILDKRFQYKCTQMFYIRFNILTLFKPIDHI